MTSAPTSATNPGDDAAPGGEGGEVWDFGSRIAPAPVPVREYAIVVATRDTDDGREFLMVEHRDRGWELPGGKLEGREGPVHAALREFREETGHLLAEPKFVMKLPKPDGVCFVFTGSLGVKVGEVHHAEAVGAMQWYRRLPALELLAFPDDPYDEMGEALGIDFGPPTPA